MQYKQIVIGVDQSYQNTGVSISADGRLLDVKSINLRNIKTNTEKRRVIARRINSLVIKCVPKAEKIVCIVEKARIHGGETSFINVDAIKAMGALTAVIVDQCTAYNIPVYSVDTRAWKSQVVGTSKPEKNAYGVPDKKWPTVRWLCSLGFENKILIDMSNTRQTKGIFMDGNKKYKYNDDAADSAGICMYWWYGSRDKLKVEK